MSINNIHIGSIIRKKLAENKMSAVQLAEIIKCHNSTLNDVYKRRSINTEQLWQIATALKYNFFTEIYGKHLDVVLQKEHDIGTITMIATADKVIFEQQKSGIAKRIEYAKVSEE